MSLNCGIIGLPNVGKSTIFSALTSVCVDAQNYPFCTIEPNKGLVPVPDERLDKIVRLYNPKKVIPAVVEFVDIAGLVAGASKGEGLGNKFLSHIRETGIVAHVVRCFDDDTVTHVNGLVDPISDIEVINTELALADLATVEKRCVRLEQEKKSRNSECMNILPVLEPLLEKIYSALNAGTPIRSIGLNDDEKYLIAPLQLMTLKPVIYVCNVKESDITSSNDYVCKVENFARLENSQCLIVCGAFEAEIMQFEKDEKEAFLNEVGLSQSGLDALIQKAYDALGLQTYFTAGEQEVRAWTYKAGMVAPQAAGIIHGDFERGFIKADVFTCEDLFKLKSESAIRAVGKLRTEGKEYIVRDGDIMYFKFNV